MIYTVTLNPSLDRVIWVDAIRTDDSLRIRSEKHYAGGKGIDVSRVVHTLNGNTTASGFLGSFNGLHLEGLLINEGVNCDFVQISRETRSNVIIFTADSSEGHIALNSKGPEVTPYDLATLFNRVTKLPDKPSFVVLGGSLPKGVAPNIYAQLIYRLRSQGVRVALDADNEPLRCGVEEKPAMIKPNQHEFTRLIGKHCETAEEILEAGQTLIRDKGIEIVLVSMGSEGLVLFNHEEAYHAVSPQVEVQSTIGSGDSAMAAFLLGWDRGEALEECARMSAAAGAATARSPGVELIRKHDYEEILPQVSSRRLELPS